MIINVMRLLIECTKFLLVLCGILNLRRKKKPVAAVVLLTICVILAAVRGIQEPEAVLSSFLWFTTIPVCALFLEEKRKVLYTILTDFAVCFIDDTIFFFVKWILGIPDEVLYRNTLPFFVVSTVSVVLFAMVAWMLRRIYKKSESVGRAVREVATPYLILFVVGLFAVSLMTQLFNFSDFEWDMFTIGTIGVMLYIFSASFLIVAFLLINNNYKKKYYLQSAEMNEKHLQMVQEYYEALLEKSEELRRFRHETKNHMFCLETLLREGDYKGAETYLEDLKESFYESSIKYQTGNLLVNAIVNDVAGKYTGVLVDWNGSLPQRMRLSNPDVCVIFFNILDNACSAAAECENGKVDVSIQAAGNSLKILVENNMVKPIEEKDDRFITKKADKESHGFGIMNVRERVSVNGGSVEFSYTDTRFTTKILLPNVL